MSAPAPRRTGATATPTEKAFDHDTHGTLPNADGPARANGSVMWAEPIPTGVGTRSGGPTVMAPATAVTRGDVAQQQATSGAAVAGDLTQRRAQPAAAVIEMNDVGERDPFAKKLAAAIEATPRERKYGRRVGRLARATLAKDRKERAGRKDTKPSQRTVQNYKRKCDLIDARMESLQDPSEIPLHLALSRYAHKKQSFFAMRAALKWRAVEKIKSLLQAQHGMQSLGRYGFSWLRCVDAIGMAIREVAAIRALTWSDALALSNRVAERSNSKKHVLPRLGTDWRQRFLDANHSSRTYRSAGLLLLHCGLRPAELEEGIAVERIGDRVQVQIRGAKVRDTAGQPWRRFALRASMLPQWFLTELDADKKTYVANADSMRTHLNRISKVLYPRSTSGAKDAVILSAYVFRHAFVTDLYLDGWTTEDIAAVLGETSADTVSWYGNRPRRGSASPSRWQSIGSRLRCLGRSARRIGNGSTVKRRWARGSRNRRDETTRRRIAVVVPCGVNSLRR